MIINIKKTEEDYESHYGVIYKITNTVNKKVYIGQTINFKTRLYSHSRNSTSDRVSYATKNYPLYRAMRKYGEDNFVVELVDYAENAEDLDKKEIFYIKDYNSLLDGWGYNQAKGGSGWNDDVRHKVIEERPKSGGKHWSAQKIMCIENGKTYDSVVDCAEDIFKDPMAKKGIADAANPKRVAKSYRKMHFVRVGESLREKKLQIKKELTVDAKVQ